MTSFAAVSSDAKFAEAIVKFHDGNPDQRTLDHLGGEGPRRIADR
jgi:hypothetical protein